MRKKVEKHDLRACCQLSKRLRSVPLIKVEKDREATPACGFLTDPYHQTDVTGAFPSQVEENHELFCSY